MVNPVRSYWVPGGPRIYGSDYKSEPAREIKEMRCYINRKEDKKMKRYLISVTVLVFVISFAGFSRAERAIKRVQRPLNKHGIYLCQRRLFSDGGHLWRWGSDEKPVHEVCVDDFYMGKYEVTQKQWTEVMGSNPSGFKNCDTCPVEKYHGMMRRIL